jgi:hypothetical protein
LNVVGNRRVSASKERAATNQLVAPKKPNAPALQRLETNLGPEPLERRLLKLFHEAHTFEEEQGVNTDEIGGKYCENCRVVADDVIISAISEGARGYALDSTNAAALWKKSEEMVGESF